MNTKITLSETTLLEKAGGKNRYRVRIIQAGQGSTGFYPADVLKEHGPTAFPKGTHCYVDHGQGTRSPDDIAGVLDSDTEFVEDDEGLYSTIKFTSRGMKIVEELKDDVGLSIHASGTIDEEGVVQTIEYSRLNSVDIVSRAGANGAILELLESFREQSDENCDKISSEQNNVSENAGADEREKMTEEDIKAVVTAVSEALAPQFAALSEALKPAEVEPPETEDAPDLVAAVEAAVEADLPKVQRESVVAAVAAGTPLEEAINAQKTLRDQILAEAAVETGGRVVGSATETDLTITWK